MRLRLSLFLVMLFSGWPTAADWIVFLGGGIQEIRGPWEVRGNQLRFHSPTGTLLSVRTDEVDLPASAFLSWQVGERRHPPSVVPRKDGIRHHVGRKHTGETDGRNGSE